MPGQLRIPRSRAVPALAGAALAVLGLLVAGVRAQPSRSAASDLINKYRDLYSNGGTVKVKPAFLPLPPGAVTPGGWLRDWAVDAASGITGHLDEYSATFGEAWKGRAVEARGAHPDGTGWPLEQASYWLDGAIRLAYILNDARLIQKVSARLDTVVDGVLNGGDSFIYWRPITVLSDPFNNWAHSHMGRALVAYYQATRNPRVLAALVKVYAAYPLPEFGSRFERVSGAVNLDAMLDTYVMSGDRRVLDRATAYARRASYRGVASEWLEGRLEPGHNVIFYENIRVPALLYPWTGNKDDLSATVKAIEWNDRNQLLPMGLSSGEEWHAGTGATRNVETCNVAASMWTLLWMLRITGAGSYADRIEQVFFNAGPAPVARDFKTMCYYQSPNRYSTALPGEEPRNPGAESYRFTNIGHAVLCCVGNLNRVIPNYVMHMWMATMDRGLAMTLYGPSAVHAPVGDNVAVDIEAQTAYPFDETIALAVKPAKEVAFPLYLRIPAWCRTPEVKVNGKTLRVTAGADSFVKVERTWHVGDTVQLRFPMAVKVVKGRETPYPQVPYFRDSRQIAKQTGTGSPYASVYYGPLLFSLPIPDENPNRAVAGANYRYALDVNSDQPGKGEATVIRHPMAGKWTWSLSAPVQLSIKAREFDWQPTDLQPLPKEAIQGGTAAEIVLVPYGCTKFRVSMFPVTETSARGRAVTRNPQGQ